MKNEKVWFIMNAGGVGGALPVFIYVGRHGTVFRGDGCPGFSKYHVNSVFCD